MKDKKPLIILVGPTAVGKTSISVKIAKEIGAEIISADSMQVYKYMDIGTAKITKEEAAGIKHYMLDEVMPDVEFSVSDFQARANNYIDMILSEDLIPLIVGGTGLYINSLAYNLDFTKAISNWKLREELLNKAETFGNQYIYNELMRIDPDSANRLHINDTKRIIRALEVYHETGRPMSSSYNRFREPNPLYDLVMIGLTMDRQLLYERINKRVDLMIEEGLIQEVQNLLDMGYHEDLVSLQGLGYKEIIKYLKGEYTLEEAIDILKRDSRRFAKRQLTWFRRDERISWIDINDYEDINHLVEYIINIIKEKLELNRILTI